jgi:hypothetical protein
MPSRRYLALQEEFFAKQDAMVQWLSSDAKHPDGSYDLSKNEEARRREKELDDLHDELNAMKSLEDLEERHAFASQERHQLATTHRHPGGSGAPQGISHTSLGTLMKDDLQRFAGERKAVDREYSLDAYGWMRPELKANFLTTSWTPEVRRLPRIIDKIAQQITILDLFGTEQMDFSGITYAEETTSTNAATEINENTAFPESSLAMTIRTVTARKIATSIPVSDELLADVTQSAAYIDNRLSTFVRKRLESQLLGGDGTPPNILGILNHSATQTQAKGGDDVLTAIFKAITKVRVTGQTDPNFILMHPNDFQDLRVLKGSDGQFLWGHPSVIGPITIFGLPLIQSTIMTENTALLGDSLQALLYLRQGVEVQLGYVSNQFKEGMQTVRASLRTGFAIFRGEGFCTITGI